MNGMCFSLLLKVVIVLFEKYYGLIDIENRYWKWEVDLIVNVESC